MRFLSFIPIFLISLAGCGSEPCTVDTNEDGQAQIICPDGTEAILGGQDGRDGEPGEKGGTGDPGEPGAKGETGDQGQKGASGNEGEQGDAGPDGQPGRDGGPGKSSFLRVDYEAPGDNCPAGGEKLTVYFDSNNNGQFDEGEAQQTDYLCYTCLSVEDLTLADWPTGEVCLDVTGDLTLEHINNSNLLGLTPVVSVSGTLTIESTSVSNLGVFSYLSSIGGDLAIRNNSNLETLEGLSALKSVGGDFIVAENAKLSSLAGLDALETIGGPYLEISSNPTLPQCEAEDFAVSLGLGTEEVFDNESCVE